jgi:hypothetical protein
MGVLMGTLIEDAATTSTWIAAALSSSGYDMDFTPASLWQVDLFFEDHAPGGVVKRRGLLSKGLGPRLFAIGAYVGEVIRRERGGKWVADDNDPEGDVNIAVHLADGTILCPMQRVLKRFQNGSEDGIAVYGQALGLNVGPRPERASRRTWWRFWSRG